MTCRLNNLEIFQNKKVLVTGHTGFKGSWLIAWLDLLGAALGVGLHATQAYPSPPSALCRDRRGRSELSDLNLRWGLDAAVKSPRQHPDG